MGVDDVYKSHKSQVPEYYIFLVFDKSLGFVNRKDFLFTNPTSPQWFTYIYINGISEVLRGHRKEG
jgi:hypothetical protein